MSTNASLTGTILSQGHSAITEMNSPGSSRTFRKIFNKNLNKTSSYDKILMNQGSFFINLLNNTFLINLKLINFPVDL